MKKILTLLSIFAFSIGLQACNENDTNITATLSIAEAGIQINTASFDVAISNSFGFGGTNGSLVFRRWKD